MSRRLEVLLALDRPEQLIEEASRLLAEDDQQLQPRLYLVIGLMEQKHWAQALAKAKQFQSELSHFAVFWLLKGQIALQLGDLLAADQSFLKGLALEPASLSLLGELALVRGFRGDLESSQAYFHQLLEQEPDNANGLINMAIVYGEVCHRPDLSRKLLRRCLSVDPHNASALALLARFSALPWQKHRILRQILARNPLSQEARQDLFELDRSWRVHGVLAALLWGLAVVLHLLPVEAFYWQVPLVFVVALQATALFRYSRHLPGVFLMVMLIFVSYPIPDLNILKALIAASLGVFLIAPCWGLHLFANRLRSTRKKQYAPKKTRATARREPVTNNDSL